jgi:ribokinase
VAGVVGHTEWVDFAVVERLPRPGQILEGREAFSAAGGGGAVAAVQLARLAGPGAFFLTVLGDDDAGRWARADLEGRGLALSAATPPGLPQRRAFTHLTDDHERTITVLGERLAPSRVRDADLDWGRCAGADAIYFTGGDAGALEEARRARVLVATPRAREALHAARVQLDVLVASGSDAGEAVEAFDPPPRHVVLTAGAAGGSWSGLDGTSGTWGAAALPAPPVDAYGCGDSFAAGLTFGLGTGLALPAALELAARCGAHCLTGRGPYGAQLTAADLKTS